MYERTVRKWYAMISHENILVAWTAGAVMAVLLLFPPMTLAQGLGASKSTKSVADHWTAARRASAIPRDLVIGPSGQGYLRRVDGSLVPYGNQRSQSPDPRPGKPGGGGDTSDPGGPAVSGMDPAVGDTIGASHTFSAQISDPDGIKSVKFEIYLPGGTTQSFSPGFAGNDTYQITLSGFTDASGWGWQVVAKDNAAKGGNTTYSPVVDFSVNTTSGGGSGGSGSGGSNNDDVVSNAQWQGGGAVQTAAGRIYFEMPTNSRLKRWSGYVCSGTVTTDNTSGRSVIITAAHCVYDDVNQAFARNVLFIPDQGYSNTSTDTNCGNDRFGCWEPSFGVVDVGWTTDTFPANKAWDYAYYVVNDSDAHRPGTEPGIGDVLDSAVGSLEVELNFAYYDDGTPGAASIDFTHALGYSYSDDPYFMHCAEDMTTEGSDNWWLPSCGLSGGSSGGPWLQPVDAGNGSIISVNSWGYTGSPGMAGPKLVGTTAGCLFAVAKARALSQVSTQDGRAGVVVDTCN